MSTWTAPVTWTAAAVSVASMNTEVRDHLTFLKGFGDLITNSTTADTGTATYLSITRALSTDTTFRALVTADTEPRFAALASGRLEWGSGSAVADVLLFRASASSLNLSADVLDMGGAMTSYTERATPGAAAANSARLFCRDNGAGKSQIAVIFNTGAVVPIATEP